MNIIKQQYITTKIVTVFLLLMTLFVAPDSRAETSYKNNNRFEIISDPPAHAAPEAVFENGAGEKVKISDLKGKVIFINFWATWCPPCRAEMPTINKLYAQFKDNKDIVFLMVDADNKYARSSAYLSKNNFDLPLYVPSGNIPYDYFSGALPTTVMINKKGEMVFRHAGAADYSDPKMIDFIRKLVAGEA